MIRNGESVPHYTWLDTVPEPDLVCEFHGEMPGYALCPTCEDIHDEGEDCPCWTEPAYAKANAYCPVCVHFGAPKRAA